MAGVALAVRVVAVVAALWIGGFSLDAYTDKGDGESYKRYALAIAGGGGEGGGGGGGGGEMTTYDTRVFPGYPLLMAPLVWIGLPAGLAGLAVTVGAATAVPPLAAVAFGDRRVGWACTVLIPHWPINSSLAMSEAPCVTLCLVGLLLSRRRPIASGLMFGLAGLVRPMAAFAVVGVLLWELCHAWRFQSKRFTLAAGPRPALADQAAPDAPTKGRRLTGDVALRWIQVGGTALGVIALGLLGIWLAFDDPLHGVRVYATDPGAYRGDLFTWPFGSIVRTLATGEVAIGRAIWTLAHVTLALAACGLIAIEAVRRPDRLTTLAAGWLVGNTLFVLTIGSDWGFFHFPRFLLPALPPLMFALRRPLPDDRRAWIVLALAMAPVAAWGAIDSP